MSQYNNIVTKILLIMPLFIVIVIFLILFFYNKSLTVFPHPEYMDRTDVYCDDEMGGESQIIDFDILSDKIIFTYMLKKSKISSFAGFSLDVSLLDISSYDIMEIDIAATVPARLLVTLMSFVEGESRLSELDTFVHYNRTINIKEENQTCKIDLNTMAKTEYAKLDTNSKLMRKAKRPVKLLFIHFKEMINVDNISENWESFDQVKTIIIEKITFSRSFIFYYILIFSVLVIYYGAYFFFTVLAKHKSSGTPGSKDDLPLIKLEVETYEQEDLRKIMNILKEDIFDPQFSIHMVYEKTGQSQTRIAHLIKEKYALSFKQLINSIRLNEAKRLLMQSDLKIYDIAFKIGYNNNTYFCKLFKKQFGQTPKEFRHQHITSGKLHS